MIKILLAGKFTRYFMVSASTLFVDYSCYWALATFTVVSLPTAAAIGYTSGLVVAYFLLIKFVFKDGWLRKKKRAEFSLFVLSGILGIITTYTIVLLCSVFLYASMHVSKLSAVFLSFILVYFFRKIIVFKS